MLSSGIHNGFIPGPQQIPTPKANTVCYTKWVRICTESMHLLSYSHMSHTGISPLRLYMTVAPQDQNGTGKPYCLVMSQLL